MFLPTDFTVQRFMSDICLVSVSVSACQLFFFLFPERPLVSVSPVEKMFWHGAAVTVTFFVSSFFISPHKPSLLVSVSLLSVANGNHSSFPCREVALFLLFVFKTR